MYYSKNSIVQADFYRYYKKLCKAKGKVPVDYQTYCNITTDGNLIIKDKIVYEGERVQLPYRLGELFVQKYENSYTEENKKKWKINWKATKEAGHVVYFESKYGYKWKWDKKRALLIGKKFYTFKACRQAARAVPDAINNKNLDFYN